VGLNRGEITVAVRNGIISCFWVIRSIGMRGTVHVAGVGERTHRVLERKQEGKRPLGRFGRRWKNNVKTDLQEMGWKSWDWFYLAQDLDRWWGVVKTVMNLRVP